MSPNTAAAVTFFAIVASSLSLRTYLAAAAAGSICAIVYVFYTYSERLNNAKIETAAHHVRIKFSSLKKRPKLTSSPNQNKALFFFSCVCMSTEHIVCYKVPDL
jgi:exosortase/archaeosortase